MKMGCSEKKYNRYYSELLNLLCGKIKDLSYSVNYYWWKYLNRVEKGEELIEHDVKILTKILNHLI